MSKLTRQQVIKLAKLSRLQLSDSEIDRYLKDLNHILEYVERLNSVDTTGLDPVYQVSGLVNVMREDVKINYQAKPSELLKGLPKRKEDYIQVRRML